MRRWLLLLPLAVHGADLPNEMEAYGHAGWFSIAGDESTGPGTLSLGGGAMIPFTRRFAFDLDLSTAKSSEAFAADSYEQRGTFGSAAVVARWGSERTYVFAGGGAGFQHQRSISRASNLQPGFRPPSGVEVAPGVFEFRYKDTKPALIARAGLVQAITSRFLLRVDLLWSHYYVAPSLGVRAGLGYRF